MNLKLTSHFALAACQVLAFQGLFLKYHAFAEYHVWTVFDGGYLKRHIVAIKTLHCDVKGFIEWMKKNYDLVHKGTIKKGHSGKIISST